MPGCGAALPAGKLLVALLDLTFKEQPVHDLKVS